MIKKVSLHIRELDLMKNYPKELNYIGNLELLKKRKVSIVGSRRPISYTKTFTTKIANELSKRDICIVSGAAMGVDSLAHRGAGVENTIAVMPTGLDIRYPSVNKSLIQNIESSGLCLSQFENSATAKAYSFVQRNEIVVALGEVLIVTQADINSGSMRSVEFALKMGKKVYVLAHRLGESEGTNILIKQNLATPIYDIDEFISSFGEQNPNQNDKFLEYCATNPPLNEALHKHGDKVYEYELNGYIEINNNILKII